MQTFDELLEKVVKKAGLEIGKPELEKVDKKDAKELEEAGEAKKVKNLGAERRKRIEALHQLMRKGGKKPAHLGSHVRSGKK